MYIYYKENLNIFKLKEILMRFIDKYNITFVDIDKDNKPLFFDIIKIKIELLLFISKIELLYYRNLSEYLHFSINIMIIYYVFNSANIDGLIGLLIVFIMFNYETLYILIQPKLPYVPDTKDDMSLDLILNNDDKPYLVVLYKNKFLFRILAANMLPHLILPLIQEFINNPDIEFYKQDFIKKNIKVSFDLPTSKTA